MNLIDIGMTEEGVLRVYLDPTLMKVGGGILGMAVSYFLYRFIKPAISAHVKRNRKRYITVAGLTSILFTAVTGIRIAEISEQRLEEQLRQSLPDGWIEMYRTLEAMDSPAAGEVTLAEFLRSQPTHAISHSGLDKMVMLFPSGGDPDNHGRRMRVATMLANYVIPEPIADIRTLNDGPKLASAESYNVPILDIERVAVNRFVKGKIEEAIAQTADRIVQTVDRIVYADDVEE